MNTNNGQRNSSGQNVKSFQPRQGQKSFGPSGKKPHYHVKPLNTPFAALQGGTPRQQHQAPVRQQSKAWPQVPRAFVPRDVLTRNETNTAMKTQQRVYLPLLHSEVMTMTSVLAIQHTAGDITVLDVFVSEAHADGKPAATTEHVILTGRALRNGEHYVVVGVYVLTSGVAFQRFGINFEDKLVRLDYKPTQTFPMIRQASRKHLEQLSQITTLRFDINTQIRWKEYSRLPDTRFEQSNTAAAALEEFNRREVENFRQAMEGFADVEVGTPLQVARELVAARLASQGEVVDTTEPTMGFVTEVVDMVEPAQPWAAPAAQEAVV